jgi:hypothetical protein
MCINKIYYICATFQVVDVSMVVFLNVKLL